MTSSHSERNGEQEASLTPPIVIRGSGSWYVVTAWTGAIVTAVFLLAAGKAAHQRDTAMVASWLAGAAFFAVRFMRSCS
jgi:hypothetical protein